MAEEPRKPRIRERRVIERAQLLRALERSSARVRTLVAGPGYGKTTLLDQWAPRNDRTVGWFRSRPSAVDVAVTARALVAASNAVVEGAGRRLLERLAVTQDPEREVTLLAEMLAEDLGGWPSEGWIVIDDYQHVAMAAASESFVETIVGRSPVQILIASQVRPSWISPRDILDGRVLEIPQTALAMSADEIDEVLEGGRTELTPALVALAEGWPVVVGLAGMVPDVESVDALLPETLLEFFAEAVYRALDPTVRTSLELLAAMPLVDRELATTLFGAERAEQVVSEALGLGILDERDGRLELHPLVESFLQSHAMAETRVKATEAYSTAWAYYTARKLPDAAFDLAHELGVPGDIDRSLIESIDELLHAGAHLHARDLGLARSGPGRRDTRGPRRPGRDRVTARASSHRASAGGSGRAAGQCWPSLYIALALSAEGRLISGNARKTRFPGIKQPRSAAIDEKQRRQAQMGAPSGGWITRARSGSRTLGGATGLPNRGL